MDTTAAASKTNFSGNFAIARSDACNHAFVETDITASDMRKVARTLVSIVAASPATSRMFQSVYPSVFTIELCNVQF